MDEAIKAFVEAKSNDKLHRALKSKTRQQQVCRMISVIQLIIKEKIQINEKGQVRSLGKKTDKFQLHTEDRSLKLVTKEEGSNPVEQEENVGKTDSYNSQSEKSKMQKV